MAAPTTKANTSPTVLDLEDLLDFPPAAATTAPAFTSSTPRPGTAITPAVLTPVTSDNNGCTSEIEESSTSPSGAAEATAVAPTEPELTFEEATARRLEAREKLKSAWERIFEKYGRDFDDEADEIDVATCKIVVDRGHLRSTNTREFGDFSTELGVKRRRSKRLREMNVDSELESEDSDAGSDEEAEDDICSAVRLESNIASKTCGDDGKQEDHRDHDVDSAGLQVAAAPRRIEYDLTPLRTHRSGLAVSRPDGLTVVRESRYELRRGTVQSMYLSESRVEYARGSERHRAVRSVPYAAISYAASSGKRRKVEGGVVVTQTPKRPVLNRVLICRQTPAL
ncbi:hypothetical protein HK405_008311 [Cladochytrium tenue]|nr:hypothetical protein HK405_008311 [Cladochytrium tenue]